MSRLDGRRELGFAVIGCGSVGRRRAADVDARPDARIRALCDREPAVRASLGGARPEVLVTDDAARAIGADGVDCVIVATPPADHARLAMLALEAGRHVLVEQPLATTLADGAALAARAAERGLVLHAAANHRYLPPVEEARALCAAGALGAIRRVRARIGHDGRRLPGWARDRSQAGGGALLDLGTHLADLVAWWGLGSRRVSVRGAGEAPPGGMERAGGGRVEFAGGPLVELWASWRVRGDYLVVAVDGAEGSLWLRVGRAAALEVRGRVTAVREWEGRFRTWERDLDRFLAEARGAEPARAEGVAALALVDALYRSTPSSPVEVALP